MFKAVLLFLATVLILPLAVTVPVAAADGPDPNDYAIPEKIPQNYPNLSSSLDQMVSHFESRQSTAREAAEAAPLSDGPSVAVTIYLSGHVADVEQFLLDNGGDPRNVGEDYIEAYVPVWLLGELSGQPGVLRVQEIIPPQPEYGPITSQGVSAHLAGPWHQAGYDGEAVKVGIIDGGFAGFRDLMGTELPATVTARCYTDVGVFTANLADCDNDTKHGTGVAEAVVDIAPKVELYIASPISAGDIQSTVDWMVAQGVSVINRSASAVSFEGPGDGTSPFPEARLKSIDHAVEEGITWVNSAGNYAERAWSGAPTFVPLESGDALLDFGEGDVGNGFVIRPGQSVFVSLRWEDAWGGQPATWGYTFGTLIRKHTSKP